MGIDLGASLSVRPLRAQGFIAEGVPDLGIEDLVFRKVMTGVDITVECGDRGTN
jgi:hypothetical protein